MVILRHCLRALAGGIVALAIAACTGEAAEPTPTPAPTDTPLPTATVLPTPRPTSSPLPAAIEPPPSGGVTTTMNVLCQVGRYGVEVRVRYGTRIRDTDSEEATIKRVRVYLDGTLREDSGPLSHRIYVREVFLGGIPNRMHTVRLSIDTWAAPKPNDIVQFTPCPAAPGDPVAQVVS